MLDTIVSGLGRAARGLSALQGARGQERRLRQGFERLRDTFYTAFWAHSAQLAGAEVEPLGEGFARVRRGDAWTIVKRYEVMLDDHVRLKVLGHKALSHRLLVERGYPVPAYVEYQLGQLGPARSLLEQHRQVVVKPVAGFGGRGVVPAVRTVAELYAASLAASRFGRSLMAEQHVDGHSYRLLYLDGELIDAVRRDPPVVVGDGVRTLRQLVDDETDARLDLEPIRALSPLRPDLDFRLTLRRARLKDTHVLAMSRLVGVKSAVNENSAEQQHVVTDQVHPGLARDLSRLVQSLGVALAGVDVIASDIGVPLEVSGGVINEINTTPGLHHHALVSAPNARAEVGARLLERLLSASARPLQRLVRVAFEE
jgi:D-alanine-D-alanine ligase-like ATP-grasp enzyme